MNKVFSILALVLINSFTFAQDTPLEFTGSVDAYWKYDFAKSSNIPTSFATDHNSVSLGMIDLLMKKKTGKTSFVGEVSFGPRGGLQSIPDIDGQSFHIQNLYATFAASDKLSFTAGYMSTFIGYEFISPLANFHYSTSYLFTSGPFQNAGIKANYVVSSKVSFMVGLFNDQWNAYKAVPEFGLNAFGSQLMITPIEGLNAYFNLLTGSESGTIIDLTASYQLSSKFKLGLNVADFSGVERGTGYSGIVLYPSYAVSDSFVLGLRAESFKSKSTTNSVKAFTLSSNIKSGGLTFIPEFRFDNASKKDFYTINRNPTKTASQIVLAMVYGF